MAIYKVSFIEENNLKTSYIIDKNEVEAGKSFCRSYPTVPASKIVSVDLYNSSESPKVLVDGFNVSIWSLFVLFIKSAIAFIPVLIIFKFIQAILTFFGLSFLM